MKPPALPNVREAVFSLKSYAGAMLALYLSYSMGLPRPFWAMTTAYIVSQPWSGAVRSKALYRLVGTFVGSAMTVYMVPRLSNSPVVMTAAMALWVGACLYMSVLDRTPRSYLFMLAGYTAAMIGFRPSPNPRWCSTPRWPASRKSRWASSAPRWSTAWCCRAAWRRR